MQDSGDLTAEHQRISEAVQNKFQENVNTQYNVSVTATNVRDLIGMLNKGSSPGCDGITAEHMVYGKCDVLCEHLSSIYTTVLARNIVPTVIRTGVIIPLLKKPTLNPHVAENYRPITLSSTHAKLLELSVMPPDTVGKTQFGFRKGRGTSFGCSLLNDVASYFNDNGSPVYMCSLDAEKCFDNIWHDALFYKLQNVLPTPHWMFLYRWYTNLRACVRWNSEYSKEFKVTRGMRQGSLLSPFFFNIFLDDLLAHLDTSSHGLRIGQQEYSSFAYADDVTLFSATIPGLQNMIDICVEYAQQWRMRFGIKKSQCMVVGDERFSQTPQWLLGDERMDTVNNLDILGVSFNSSGDETSHVDRRMKKCSCAFYSLGCAGLAFPGISADVKSYLWKSVCVHSLTYGLDLMCISKASMAKLESKQGLLIKQAMGIGKRSHHSKLLEAMNILPVEHTVQNMTLSLFHRIMQCDCPARDLNVFMMARYINTGQIYKRSLVGQIITLGLSPVCSALSNKPVKVQYRPNTDGVVDSIRTLLEGSGCTTWSYEHTLLRLLTRTF